MDGTGESWFAVSLPPPVLLELISLQPSSLTAGICVFLVDLSTGPPATNATKIHKKKCC
jgi:hypothetical protein